MHVVNDGALKEGVDGAVRPSHVKGLHAARQLAASQVNLLHVCVTCVACVRDGVSDKSERAWVCDASERRVCAGLMLAASAAVAD